MEKCVGWRRGRDKGHSRQIGFHGSRIVRGLMQSSAQKEERNRRDRKTEGA